MSSRRAFTLIELLVVIAIIALLVSILMPSLSASKILAVRAACLSNARGTMGSLHMYASDYGEFPVNIRADINTGQWTDDWLTPDHPDWLTNGGSAGVYGSLTGTPRAWPTLRNLGAGAEGGPSHWRGHLINGKYGMAQSLGCGRGLPSNGIPHHGDTNWLESTTQGRQDIRKAPPYVYMGPGVDLRRAAEYYTGIDTGGTRHWRSYRMGATPILAESCYMTDRIYPPVSMRMTFHSHKPYYLNNAGPPSYVRDIDMTVAWTDGRAANHVKIRVPAGYNLPKLFEHNWAQWDHQIR